MTRKIMAAIALAAFFNTLFASCTQYTKMSLSDVLYSNHKRIIEVTTNDGERVVFDSVGARYLKDSKSIVGMAQDGSRAHKFTRDLDQITFIDPTRQDTLPLILPVDRFISHATRRPFDQIGFVATKQGQVYQFRAPGATIDRSTRTFIGMSQASPPTAQHNLRRSGAAGAVSSGEVGKYPSLYSTVAIPFDSVEYLQVRNKNEMHTWRYLYLTAAIGCLVYALVTYDPPDWDDDWDWD
jgi:hypothetical protein